LKLTDNVLVKCLQFTVSGVVNTLSRIFLPSKKKTERHELLERLYAIGNDSDHLANSILAILVGSTVELTLVLTNIVNFLLDGERLKEITKLSQSTEPSAHERLRGFVWEAARLDPAFQGVFRTSTKDVQVGDLSVQKGDRLFLDMAVANLNVSNISPFMFSLVRRLTCAALVSFPIGPGVHQSS
jgi:linoleate 10R-lipoxygenase